MFGNGTAMFKLSEQRLADQYLVILRDHLLPATRINIIKHEIEQDIRL